MKKIKIFMVILLTSQTMLNAQYKFEETLRIQNEDYLYSQTLDSSNTNYLAVGYCNVSPAEMGKDILLVNWDKYSMGYNSVFYYSGPGARDDEGRHIIKISDGGFLIVGNTNSYKTATDNDGFALMINSSGAVQWINDRQPNVYQ